MAAEASLEERWPMVVVLGVRGYVVWREPGGAFIESGCARGRGSWHSPVLMADGRYMRGRRCLKSLMAGVKRGREKQGNGSGMLESCTRERSGVGGMRRDGGAESVAAWSSLT
jgi:hypothetical protein